MARGNTGSLARGNTGNMARGDTGNMARGDMGSMAARRSNRRLHSFRPSKGSLERSMTRAARRNKAHANARSVCLLRANNGAWRKQQHRCMAQTAAPAEGRAAGIKGAEGGGPGTEGAEGGGRWHTGWRGQGPLA
eukprot:362778-Chlamydomonas_euryale.AAC.6